MHRPKKVPATNVRRGKMRLLQRGYKKDESPRWLFRCECGDTVWIDLPEVRAGMRRTCGWCAERKAAE